MMKNQMLKNPWGMLVFLMLSLFLGGCPAEPVQEDEEFFMSKDMYPYEFDGEPTLEAPDRLLFLGLSVGETGVQQAAIQNVGRTGLRLEDFRVEGPFELVFPEYLDSPPQELSPGQSLLLEVSYLAVDEEPREGTLTIESNDPKREFHEIALLGNVDLPCLIVDPMTRLRFGSVLRGESGVRSIRLINCSETQPVEVDLEDLVSDGGFSFGEQDDQAGIARVLEPGTTQLVPIRFSPEEVRPYEGSITVRSEDAVNPEVEVELRGEGTPPGCPEAVIRGVSMEGTRVAAPQGVLMGEPLEVVNFDGSLSEAYGGNEIAAYEWSLVSRPADTVVELGESTGEFNSLYLELAGTYEVELHVYDTEGIRSCEPARMVVESVSGDGLHIQLVWTTPNDSSRTNGSGSDVDLHLLHPEAGGVWNEGPWDCYWMNKTPIWSNSGEPDKNPTLDIDKIDGWGPENINLHEPEDGLEYSVGVYYFSDHGYGRSYATVRIFIDGILELELNNRELMDHDFWHVADVAWPSEMITIYDAMMDGFPN